MTDFSFANHVRPTVDQLCGYKRMMNLAHRNQVISDLQFCVLLDIPVNELLERKKFPATEELWGAERVAQELNVPVEHVSVLHAQEHIVTMRRISSMTQTLRDDVRASEMFESNGRNFHFAARKANWYAKHAAETFEVIMGEYDRTSNAERAIGRLATILSYTANGYRTVGKLIQG